MVVRRGGKTQVALKAKTGRAGGRTVLGVVLRVDFQFPFSVKIDAGNVGGPSAGLMFSLGIYDKVTNGALTGGHEHRRHRHHRQHRQGRPDRRHPAEAGRCPARAAPSYFLAPADNCDEVRGAVPDGLQVGQGRDVRRGRGARSRRSPPATRRPAAC